MQQQCDPAAAPLTSELLKELLHTVALQSQESKAHAMECDRERPIPRVAALLTAGAHQSARQPSQRLVQQRHVRSMMLRLWPTYWQMISPTSPAISPRSSSSPGTAWAERIVSSYRALVAPLTCRVARYQHVSTGRVDAGLRAGLSYCKGRQGRLTAL